MFEGDLDAFLDSSKFQESPQLGRGVSVSQILGTNTHAAPNPNHTLQIFEISNSSASNLPPSNLGRKPNLNPIPNPPQSSSKNEDLSALNPNTYDFGESQLDSLGYSNPTPNTPLHPISNKNLKPNPYPNPYPNPNLPRNLSDHKSKKLPPKVPNAKPNPKPSDVFKRVPTGEYGGH
jgi:hypothetical protein